MADPIVINIQDQVAGTIQQKLKAIADNAIAANTAVTTLAANLPKIDGRGFDALTKSAQAATAAINGVGQSSNSLGQINTAANSAAGSLNAITIAANNAQTSLNNLSNLNVKIPGIPGGGGGGPGGILPTVDIVNAARLIGDSIVKVGKAMLDATDSIQNLNAKLNLVSASSIQADKAFDGLYKTAQNARVSFTGLADTYNQIARSTSQLGTSQKDLQRVTETIAKATTIGGGSAQSIHAALVQLSQGFASGVLRGQELNSVMEQTPRLAQAIADGLGVPLGELRKMGAQGELTSQQLMDALLKASTRIDEEFGKMSETTSQAFQKLTNAATVFWSELDKAIGVSTAVRFGIDAITSAMEGLTRVAHNYNAELARRNELEKSLQTTNYGSFDETGGGAAVGGLRAARRSLGLTRQTDVFDQLNKASTGYQDMLDQSADEFIKNFKGKTKLGDLQNDLAKLTKAYEQVKGGAKDAGEAEKVYLQAVQERIDKYEKEDKAKDRAAAHKAEIEARREERQELIQQAFGQERLNKARKEAQAYFVDDEKRNASVQSYVAVLNEANSVREKQIQLQIESLALSDREREEIARLSKVDEDYQKKRLDLQKQYQTQLAAVKNDPEKKLGLDDTYNREVAALESYYKTRVQMEKDATEQIRAAQNDWLTGAMRAVKQYQDTATESAKIVEGALTNGFKAAEDSLVSFVTTGKLNFGSFANSIIQDLARIAAKQAVTGLVGSLFSMGLGSLGDMTGKSLGGTYGPQTQAGLDKLIGGFASGGYTGDMAADKVAGVVHGREFVFDAASTAYYGADNLASMMAAAGKSGSAAAMPTGKGSPMGASAVMMNVEIINTASGQVEATAQQGQDSNGNPNLQVLIRQIDSQIASGIRSGNSDTFKAIGQSFNVRPTPGNR